MKIRTLLSWMLLGGMLLCSAMPAEAQRVYQSKKKQDSSKRFSSQQVARVSNKSQTTIYHGIVATFSGIYYSGDVMRPGEVLKYGAFLDQISGSVTLNYKMTINPYVSMRFGAQVGFLRATNAKDTKVSSDHQFKSTFLEPFVGVEVYPILNYGFFIYGGLGLTGSLLEYKHQRRSTTYTSPAGGKAWGLLPMAQFGIGYNWFVSRDWTLGVELMGQIGFLDGQRYGLDGWPYKQAFDLNSADYVRRTDEETAYRKAKGPDGWLQLGFVVSYHF